MNTKPEQLTETELKKAQGLAGKLTQLRKFLYLFFSGMTTLAVIWMCFSLLAFWLCILMIILAVIYMIFKFRDYIRGTI